MKRFLNKLISKLCTQAALWMDLKMDKYTKWNTKQQRGKAMNQNYWKTQNTCNRGEEGESKRKTETERETRWVE